MARPRTARCGTDSGYYRHIRQLKEPACAKCLRAHADATAARDAGRRHVYRRCVTCGAQVRTELDKCYVCRKIEASVIGPEPVWVLQGGVWRDRSLVRQVAS